MKLVRLKRINNRGYIYVNPESVEAVFTDHDIHKTMILIGGETYQLADSPAAVANQLGCFFGEDK